MLASVCYLVLRWLFEFVALRAWSKERKELEIIVLRHELGFFGARRADHRSPPLTACSWLPRADCCHARSGDPSLSRRRRSCAGIDA